MLPQWPLLSGRHEAATWRTHLTRTSGTALRGRIGRARLRARHRAAEAGPRQAQAASAAQQPPVAPLAPRRRRRKRMDRRGRRLRPSRNEGVRDPRRRRELPELSRRTVAARRQAQRLARLVRQAREGPHAGPADHGPGGLAARVHQGVLGLSRHPGERRARRERPGDAGQAQGDLRQGREGTTASTATPSPRSGASSRTTARSAATVR